MKKITNKEFDIETIICAQNEDGALIIQNTNKKTSFFEIVAPLLKAVPEDKMLDLEYLLTAQQVLIKIKAAQVHEEIELEDAHYNLIKQQCQQFKVAFISDGAINVMQYIKSL